MAPKTRSSRQESGAATGRARQSSDNAELERAGGPRATQPDVKTQFSLAYGSPARQQFPSGLAPRVRGARLAGTIGDAIHSVDGSSTPRSDGAETPIGFRSVSFNVEGPVGRHAGLDTHRRRSPTGTPTGTEDTPNVFWRILRYVLMAALLVAAAQAALKAPGVTPQAEAMVRGLAARAQRAVAALPLGAPTTAANLTWSGEHPSELNKLSSEVRDLHGRLASLEATRVEVVPRREQRPAPRGINAFAPASGVLVDPYLTSPTKQVTEKSRLGPIYRKVLGAPITRPASPYSALHPWEDLGDCWCAATPEGQAQLGLALPRRIAPSTFVVEHIPEWGTPNPGATPKDIELWIQIKDPELRSLVAARSNLELGTPRAPTRSETVPALDESWVRVAAGRYDLQGPTAQTFDVPTTIPLANMGAYAGRAAVRINSAWGDVDHICLYRVKMLGLPEVQESRIVE